MVELDNLTLRLRVVEAALSRTRAGKERLQLDADRCQTVRRIMEIGRRASEANCPMQSMRVQDSTRGLQAGRCALGQ
jgi:hypothetical protein